MFGFVEQVERKSRNMLTLTYARPGETPLTASGETPRIAYTEIIKKAGCHTPKEFENLGYKGNFSVPTQEWLAFGSHDFLRPDEQVN